MPDQSSTAAPQPASHRLASGGAPQRGYRYALLVLLGFALATASFIAATLYADARLQGVARMSHDVSDNAMPSIVELAVMRRELVYLEHLYDELAQGDMDSTDEIPAHRDSFDRAERAYRALPLFPDEPELWQHGQAKLEDSRQAMRSIADKVAAADYAGAEAQVNGDLVPTAREADEILARLIVLNNEHGRLAAAKADAARSRTRRLTFLLDAICVLITAALALAAYLGLRRNALTTERRANELESFASRVAHDIRSPMQPAMLALQSFARQGDERVQRGAERGLRGLRRVERMVDNLLAFARSGAAPEPGNAPLRDVVAGVVQDVEPDATAAHIQIRVGELPPCEAACTTGVLTSIVQNLVGNAIKHFPPDKEPRQVTVDATARGGRVHVEVADTGGGIEPAEQERIFNPYTRVDKRRPGLGLGLATVRRLVDSYRGKVGVRSSKGEGAVFWFESRSSAARGGHRLLEGYCLSTM